MQVKLVISIFYYNNKDYFVTYGYIETAIENIRKLGLGSSMGEIKKVAIMLDVDIYELSHDKICESLWNRFYELTDEDFEHFTPTN